MHLLFSLAIIFSILKGFDLQEEAAACHGSLNGIEGTVFTRWGHVDCPSGGRLLYSGFAVGTGDHHSGGASSLLCIPEKPSYDSTTTQLTRRKLSHLYGAEYTNTQGVFGSSDDGDRIPCAECLNPYGAVTHVFPAEKKCLDESWDKEYSGYMSAGLYNEAGRYSPICVDKSALPAGSSTATNYKNPSMVLLSASCKNWSGFKCPRPYKENTPIACVVCTYFGPEH